MITVKVQRNANQDIVNLKVSGHANSGPYGQDLVCAAVSAIVTGGFNCINKTERFNMVLDSGNAKIELKPNQKISKHDELVLEVMCTQLETIADSYGPFIEIKTLL